jgi:hypothetical protein
MSAFELTRWYAYRRIRHPDMVHIVWTWPLLAACFFSALYLVTPSKPQLFGAAGIMAGASMILATLPGFFIAALAAISALRNRSLDRSLEGDAPKLERRVRGRPIIVELNIRQFLLFSAAYTSALSLCLLIVATTFSYAFSESAVLSYVGSELFFYVAGTILFLFLYFCSSLIVTTAHMIYFLSEGAHLPV